MVKAVDVAKEAGETLGGTIVVAAHGVPIGLGSYVQWTEKLDGRIGQEADEAGGIWAEGVGSLRKVFGTTSIGDIARREAEEAGAGMYHI